MPRYVVLLRGVNVGKTQRVPMADFKALLQGLGHQDVTTVLNSGNAVFTSASRTPGRLAQNIARALADSLGVSAAVVVKSGAEFAALVAANPMAVPEQEHSKFLVVFANDAATLQGLESLQPLVQAPERLVVGPHAAYLHCAAGILQSRVGAALLGKVGQSVTTRNWGTTLRLLRLCGTGAA